MTKTSMGPYKRDDDYNELITDHKKMCEIFKDQYVSSHSVQKEEPELATVENQTDEDLPTMNDIQFTENDLIASINELRTNCPDGILTLLLKKTGTALSVPRYLMWKTSMRSGSVLTALKTENICPV